MLVEVPRIKPALLLEKNNAAETSATIRARVTAHRQQQWTRAGQLNADLSNHRLEKFCQLAKSEREFISNAMEKLQLSPRSFHRILRLARTIADLAASDNITLNHLAEAVNFRRLTDWREVG